MSSQLKQERKEEKMEPKVSFQTSLFQNNSIRSELMRNQFLKKIIEERKVETIDPKLSPQTFTSISQSSYKKNQPIKNQFSEHEEERLRNLLFGNNKSITSQSKIEKKK